MIIAFYIRLCLVTGLPLTSLRRVLNRASLVRARTVRWAAGRPQGTVIRAWAAFIRPTTTHLANTKAMPHIRKPQPFWNIRAVRRQFAGGRRSGLLRRLILGVVLCWIGPGVLLPAAAALVPEQLAVLINADDPLSVESGIYYSQRRGIPMSQVIVVRLGAPRPVLRPAEFERIKARLDKDLPDHVQAIALTFSAPYRVDCMSITSAFAFGFDRRFCARSCAPTAPSPYFKSASKRPYQDFGMRLAMSLAGENAGQLRRLVDRGIRADGSQPHGTAYLLSTSDAARNVRAAGFPAIASEFSERFRIQQKQSDRLGDRFDIMFYFTGLKRVPGIQRLGFRAGAVADHLTSAGGQLTDSRQMSALEWLAAGATGSYGTVVEPCNYREKFPDPQILMRHYLRGDTLIEAYWKSVDWPGQGIFVGEPLARPFGR